MHSDWQRLTLATWAKWVADNRPLAFSLYGDSVHAREMFRGRHRRSYRSDSPLWEETSNDWLHELDGRLCGALSERERLILLAAVVPLGRVAPAAERAAAAGCSVDELRRVRRAAMALIG